MRESDPELGLTVHLMDERFDTGPILAQGSRPMPADTTLEGTRTTRRSTRPARATCSCARGAPGSSCGAPAVPGPFAIVDGRRLRVRDATLDDPSDPDAIRLDAADGPIWQTDVEVL